MSSYPSYATSPSPNLLRFPVHRGSYDQASDSGTPYDEIDRRKSSFASVNSAPPIYEQRETVGQIQNDDSAEEINKERDESQEIQNNESESDSRRKKFILVSLCISQIWSSMFYSLLAPFFPTEAQKQGASNTETGFILGIFPALVFLTAPIYGKYITVLGPKFMYVTGIFGTSTCAILFGVLQWCPKGVTYVAMCFLTRTVEALMCSMVGVANLTIASKTFASRISSIMGILQACSCVGLMTGPPLGGLLFSVGGFYLPFAICGGVYMLCGLLSWIILPSIQGEETPTLSPSRWKLLRIPVILLVGYLMIVGQAAIGFCDVALAVHVGQFHLSPAIVGLLFLIPSGAVIILAPLAGWIVDKNVAYARIIIIGGASIGAVGFLGLGPSPLISKIIPPKELWVTIVSLATGGVGMSCLVITYTEFLIATRERNFPETIEVKGMISGMYNSLNALGSFLGPTVGGIMLQHLGFDWSSTIFSAGCILAAIMLTIYTVAVRCQTRCCHSVNTVDQNGVSAESLLSDDTANNVE